MLYPQLALLYYFETTSDEFLKTNSVPSWERCKSKHGLCRLVRRLPFSHVKATFISGIITAQKKSAPTDTILGCAKLIVISISLILHQILFHNLSTLQRNGHNRPLCSY